MAERGNAAPDHARVRHVVGCMTGTSLDGLDAALTRITGEGLGMTAEFVGMVSRPFDDDTRAMLLHLAGGNPAPPIDYMRAARTLGVLHAAAIEQLLADHPIPGPGTPSPDFVVAHGQTIWHAPADRLSWQLFDPWPIARHLGAPVCYDLRQADLIAGGEGAPITPIADKVVYGQFPCACIVNLGGIVNTTRWWTRDDSPTGLDLGPCNLLLDGLVRRLFPGQAFDAGGAIAGSVEPPDSAARFIGDYLHKLSSGQKTLGREVYHDLALDQLCAELSKTNEPNSIIAAACAWVAGHVGQWIEGSQPSVVVLAGGGAKNSTLVRRLRELDITTERMCLSDDLGIPCEAREAMGLAVLGALSQDGVPITLPQVTGAADPGVAGAWVYPS